MNDLFKGAIKSAVSSACGLIIGLPAVDPEHFSLITRVGMIHIATMIAVVVISSEARFWKGWADEVTGSGKG